MTEHRKRWYRPGARSASHPAGSELVLRSCRRPAFTIATPVSNTAPAVMRSFSLVSHLSSHRHLLGCEDC